MKPDGNQPADEFFEDDQKIRAVSLQKVPQQRAVTGLYAWPSTECGT